MSALVESLNSWSQAWAALAWAVLWQSTLVALLVGLAAGLLRRGSPALRYWLWQIVAIKLLLMPFWTLPVALPELGGGELADGDAEARAAVPRSASGLALPLPEPSADGVSEAAATAPAAPSWWQRALRSTAAHAIAWQSWLLAVWLLGVAWQLGNIVRQGVRLSRLLHDSEWSHDGEGAQDSRPRDRSSDRQAVGLGGDALREATGELARRLELTRVPGVVVADSDGSPFVCRVRRPVLVLPRAMLEALEPAQLRQVLLHELAHVKRRDLLWGWIPELARIFYWLHPVAHWIGYRVRLERELACDQLAMAHSGQSAAGYAETLVKVVNEVSTPAVLKAAAGSAGMAGGATHLSTKTSHEEIER